ncbi:MAG: hypothetical protein F2642_05815, partial [Actinobacteria bacterium]|nr:hypothetical protein [Actinomycetota bacterium]
MKKFLTFTIIICLTLTAQVSYGAPKPVVARTLVPLFSLPENEKPAGFLISGNTLNFFGTSIGMTSTDGFLKSTNESGVIQWSLILDTGVDEIATTATKNSAGEIWIVGSSAKPSILDTSTVVPAVTSLNPDSVTAEIVPPIRND